MAIFLANNLWSYLLVAGFTFLAIAMSGVPASLIWKAIKPLWIILVFTMGIHVLTTPGNELLPGNLSISVRKAYGTASL